jgi:hypothetical protein
MVEVMSERDRIVGTSVTNLNTRGYVPETRERPDVHQNKKALINWLEERRERIEANRYKVKPMRSEM